MRAILAGATVTGAVPPSVDSIRGWLNGVFVALLLTGT
jgi:hypothetical protein